MMNQYFKASPFILFTLIVTTTYSASASTQDCVEKIVPYSYSLSEIGSSFAQILVDNSGPQFTTVSDSNSFVGAFNIVYNHTPPSKVCQSPNTPTVNFAATGIFEGTLFTTGINTPIPGLEGPFATASTMVDILPAFNSEERFNFGTTTINQTQVKSYLITGDTNIPFSGSIDGTAKFTLGIPELDGSISQASIDLSGMFIGPTSGNLTYHVSVPEPASILSLFALGTLGAASTLKRKLKSSKSIDKELEKVS